MTWYGQSVKLHCNFRIEILNLSTQNLKMRQLAIYRNNILAGILIKENRQDYRFEYNHNYFRRLIIKRLV